MWFGGGHQILISPRAPTWLEPALLSDLLKESFYIFRVSEEIRREETEVRKNCRM